MKHLRLFLTLALAVLVASHGWAQTHPLASIVNGLPNPTAIHYVAPSGKAVRKGDILVVLDCLPTLAKWREIQNAIPAAEAEAKANEQKIAPTEADKTARLAALTYEVTQADRLLHKYIEGDAPANQLSLQLAVIDAQAAYDQALSRYNTRDKLLQEGYIQKIEYDNDEVTLNRAKVALDAAKVRFDSFVNFDKPLTADSLTRTLNDKKAALESTRVQADQNLAAIHAAMDAAAAKAKALSEEGNRWSEFLQKTALGAPADGHFTAGDPAHPEWKVEQGGTAAPGQVLGLITP